MTFLDILSAIYVVLSGLRGRIGGLGRELYRTLRTLIAAVAGMSLFRLVGDLLARLPLLEQATGRFAGFLLLFAATWLVLLRIRAFVIRLCNERLAAKARRTWGFLLGIVRSAILVGVAVFGLNLLPVLPGVVRDAAVSRIVRRVAPDAATGSGGGLEP